MPLSWCVKSSNTEVLVVLNYMGSLFSKLDYVHETTVGYYYRTVFGGDVICTTQTD